MNSLIDIIKRALRPRPKKTAPFSIPKSATVLPRNAHSISRKNISKNALRVLYHLKKEGFGAFLVGGCVRDMLLGHEPKDFDVATDAKPEQVRRLFRNCRLIGKRFRLAHVYFKDEIIEVATFRSGSDTYQDGARSHHGLLLRDNVYGGLEDDVWRRDFTINALYYNIADFSVLDFTGGMEDLQKGTLKIIGNPRERYREDPVRMLRAIRFASKLGFRLETDTANAIPELANLISHVSNARLFDECIKLFLTGYADDTYALLRQYHLSELIFPSVENVLSDPELHQGTHQFISLALQSTDKRVSEGKSVTPAYLFAALLWMPLQKEITRLLTEQYKSRLAFEKATNHVLNTQNESTGMPKFCLATIRDIWGMQYYLEKPSGKRPLKLVQQPRFRAAYDFFLLRAALDPELQERAAWWTDFYHAGEHKKLNMIEEMNALRRKKIQENS